MIIAISIRDIVFIFLVSKRLAVFLNFANSERLQIALEMYDKKIIEFGFSISCSTSSNKSLFSIHATMEKWRNTEPIEVI